MSTTHTARILHTSDWQLGMTRHFLSSEAQSRFDQSRLASIRRIFEIAIAKECDAIVVAGDVFDNNMLEGRQYLRAIEVLRQAPVPVYLLPGNHDPYDPMSIYRKDEFRALAENESGPVTVLSDSSVHSVPGRGMDDGVLQIVGAPLLSKSADRDLVAGLLGELEESPVGDGIRVIVGHGAVESFGDSDRAGQIDVQLASAQCRARVADYVALGDTHSATQLDEHGNVWYSGAPEVTDFLQPGGGGESNSGKALVVTIGVDVHASHEPSTISVEEVEVGTWSFLALEESVNSLEDAQEFIAKLEDLENKPETVVKYALVGAINLDTEAYLEARLAELSEVFAALYIRERTNDLHVIADESELDGAIFGDSFIRVAVQRLIEEREANAAEGATDPSEDSAGDALKLLYRLTGAKPKVRK